MFVNTHYGTYWVTRTPTKRELRLTRPSLAQVLLDEDVVVGLGFMVFIIMILPGGIAWIGFWATAGWIAPISWVSIWLLLALIYGVMKVFVARHVRRAEAFRRARMHDAQHPSCKRGSSYHLCVTSAMTLLLCATDHNYELLSRYPAEVDAFLGDFDVKQLLGLLHNEEPKPSRSQAKKLGETLIAKATQVAARLDELDAPRRELIEAQCQEEKRLADEAAQLARIKAEEDRNVLDWQIRQALGELSEANEQ